MLKRLMCVMYLISIVCVVNAQEVQWCFGDSAGIDFRNPNNPVAIHTSIKSRGSCANICNSAGDLLFYTGFDAMAQISSGPPNNGNVYNRNHNLMLNGDLIAFNFLYQEVLIIPDPADTNQYYIFSVCPLLSVGLFYSKVDMTLDNGLGAVTVKNVRLQAVMQNDGIFAVQHGNGCDWWVYTRNVNNSNNEYIRYLIDRTGVHSPLTQNIGNVTFSNLIKYFPDKQLTKVAAVGYQGMLATFEVDQCTGEFLNTRIIQADDSTTVYHQLSTGEFSPSGNLLYVNVGSYLQPGLILQFNLLDSIPLQTVDTVYQYVLPNQGFGDIRRAINDKLYWTTEYYSGSGLVYPYTDTTYNVYNMNLSVINLPDSIGSSCDFQPFSFYLGGSRTYVGLPNNPNRSIGAVNGSICDTLSVGLNELGQSDYINVFPNPADDHFYISCNSRDKSITSVVVYNKIGQRMENVTVDYKQSNMAEVKCSSLMPGVYFVQCSFNSGVAKTQKIIVY